MLNFYFLYLGLVNNLKTILNKTMKKIIMSTVLLATLISCGPSASEKAALAKADSLKVADSLLTLSITKAVVDSTMKADSIAKIAVDTIKVVEVSAKK